MKTLTVEKLHEQYNQLQIKFGPQNLDPIYGAGCTDKPNLCFVFMNPTARNIAASKSWQGIKAPWIGTKSVWKLFNALDLMDEKIFQEIRSYKPDDWNEEFARIVYENIKQNQIFITNLAKCTQPDARPLPNNVFKKYRPVFEKEIREIDPDIIITFGNQVSSVFLDQTISVSKVRKKPFEVSIAGKDYPTYSVYYPVGQGMRNIDKSIEDIRYIMSSV